MKFLHNQRLLESWLQFGLIYLGAWTQALINRKQIGWYPAACWRPSDSYSQNLFEFLRRWSKWSWTILCPSETEVLLTTCIAEIPWSYIAWYLRQRSHTLESGIKGASLLHLQWMLGIFTRIKPADGNITLLLLHNMFSVCESMTFWTMIHSIQKVQFSPTAGSVWFCVRWLLYIHYKAVFTYAYWIVCCGICFP